MASWWQRVRARSGGIILALALAHLLAACATTGEGDDPVIAKSVEEQQTLIRERVAKAWAPPKSFGKGLVRPLSATLAVTLDPTGAVKVVKILRRSGQRDYDASLVKAVLDAAPLPLTRNAAIATQFRVVNIDFATEPAHSDLAVVQVHAAGNTTVSTPAPLPRGGEPSTDIVGTATAIAASGALVAEPVYRHASPTRSTRASRSVRHSRSVASHSRSHHSTSRNAASTGKRGGTGKTSAAARSATAGRSTAAKPAVHGRTASAVKPAAAAAHKPAPAKSPPAKAAPAKPAAKSTKGKPAAH